MGKIVKLKNKKTGVRVYPVTATSAVVDANSGERLNDTLQNKVEEAPMDNEQYARINGAWAKVEGGGDETALITLLPNSEDLYGVSVKVTTEGGETLLDTTWQGSVLSVQIPANTIYTVTVGEKDGFIAPSAKSYTATKGATRSISMTYTESKLTVNILSNQGTSDSDISGVKATVSYGSTSLQVGNGQTISLPQNVDVTITFPTVTNYKSPSTISFTHSGGTVQKSGTYQTEIVNVTLSANNGISVAGQKVTINGTQHTWNGTTISQKVPFGTSYSIFVDAKAGYTTPTTQSLTASQSSRNLELVYYQKLGTTTPSPGTYIKSKDGYYLTESEWNKSIGIEVEGVALIDDNCSFLISLETYSGQLYNDSKVYPNMSEISYEASSEDYNGLNNTTKINSRYVDTGDVKTYVAAQCIALGGYLGASGEVITAYNNEDTINSLLSACGGDPLPSSHWTSSYKGVDSNNDVCFWYYLKSDKRVYQTSINSDIYFKLFKSI